MTVVKQRVVSMESSLETLNQQEEKYAAELDASLEQYAELRQQVADINTTELETVCQVIRPDKERDQKEFNSSLLLQSRKEIAGLLDELLW